VSLLKAITIFSILYNAPDHGL